LKVFVQALIKEIFLLTSSQDRTKYNKILIGIPIFSLVISPRPV